MPVVGIFYIVYVISEVKILPVLASVSNAAAEPGAEGAEVETVGHDSCLAPCLHAGTSSKGNFAT